MRWVRILAVIGAVLTVALLVVAFMTLPAEAMPTLEERVEALEATVNDPEGRVRATEDNVKKVLKVTPTGYLQLRYVTSQDSKDGSSVVDGFSVRRARLGLNLRLGSDVAGKVSFDGAKGFELKDAFVVWYPYHGPELGPSLTFGQQNWCFGREVPVSSSVRECPERALAWRMLFAGERDMGLKITSEAGEPVILELGVFNGTGINKADTNNEKDIVARLGFTPCATLDCGVSGYWGQARGLPVGVTTLTPRNLVKRRFGADAAWVVWNGFTLKGECVFARERGRDPWGWLAQANLSAGRKAVVVVRFDTFDSDGIDPVRRTNTWQAGVVRYVDPNLKCKLFYEIPDERGHDTRNNRVTFETLLAF